MSGESTVVTAYCVRPVNGSRLYRCNNPELCSLYVTEDSARKAATTVLERTVKGFVTEIECVNASCEPAAARREQQGANRYACITEQRITEWGILWDGRKSLMPVWWPKEGVATLDVHSEVRHYWREVIREMRIDPDGTVVSSQRLGPPGKPSDWRNVELADRPNVWCGPVSVEVYPHRFSFAHGEDLVAWIGVSPDD